MNKNSRAAMLLFAAGLLSTASWATENDAPAQMPVTVLLINDVYRLDYLAGVRTLRQELEQQYGKVLLLHAGDFLFPSLLSRRFEGAQMIDMMNMLDGDAEAYDPLMFVTFGNHEFEKDKLEDAQLVSDRINESQFDWVSSNIEFKRNEADQPLVQSPHLHSYRLLDVDGVQVGLFGITINNKHPAYVDRFDDYVETSRAMTAKLRAEGADLVIGLTHLTVDLDKELLGRLEGEGPDIIFGGHEHNRQTVEIDGRVVIKADADAYSTAVVRITPQPGRPPLVEHSFRIIPGEITFDPLLDAKAHEWEGRYQNEYCEARRLAPSCLDEVVGKTQSELVAEELTIRRFETNLGDWIMDRTLDVFRPQGAQIAFVNAGSLRLNHNIPADSNITRKTLNELFAYPNHMVLIRLTGAQLQQVVERAVEDWTGNGHWLQIGGFSFRHHPERGLVDGLSLVTPTGLQPVKPDEEILAVTNYYLLDDTGDRDGYLMLNPGMLVDPEAQRFMLRDIVINAFEAAGESGISVAIDGRVCNAQFIAETCRRAE